MEAVICVLSHYPDLFERFRADVDIYEPGAPKILVRDGELIRPFFEAHWITVNGKQPFNFSRNMNLAWRLAGRSDVVIAGDDVQFTTPFIYKLQQVAYSDPKIGFAVPELGGQSCFVCAYIKRELIDGVGWMDERFEGYGWQDNDYYRRFEAMGWRTQPTTDVEVIHNGATSFHRKVSETREPLQASCDRNQRIYEAKWGEPNG